MDFMEVMRALDDGMAFRRSVWKPGHYIRRSIIQWWGVLYSNPEIRQAAEHVVSYQLNRRDIFATDWESCPEGDWDEDAKNLFRDWDKRRNRR